MRSVLPFRLQAGVDRPWLHLLRACAVLALVMMAWWSAQLTWGGAPASVSALILAWLATAAVAAYGLAVWHRARHQPPLDLAWDGAAWTLAGASPSADRIRCHLKVRLDAGRWLLLEVRPEASTSAVLLAHKEAHTAARSAQSLALHADSHAPATWHALRCALLAPPPAPREAPAHER